MLAVCNSDQAWPGGAGGSDNERANDVFGDLCGCSIVRVLMRTELRKERPFYVTHDHHGKRHWQSGSQEQYRRYWGSSKILMQQYRSSYAIYTPWFYDLFEPNLTFVSVLLVKKSRNRDGIETRSIFLMYKGHKVDLVFNFSFLAKWQVTSMIFIGSRRAILQCPPSALNN